MPRIVFILLFLVVAAIPLILFGLLQRQPTGQAAQHSGHYRRGFSFYSIDLDMDSSRGRNYNTGSFQGGGFHSGK
jgi:hypothetical protein